MKLSGPARTQAGKSVIGMRRLLVLGALSAALVAFGPVGRAQAAVAEPAMIVGRVTFRDSVRQARAEDVERLRWGRLIVQMRRGWEV